MTAIQADIRRTASKKSRVATGTRATRVSPATDPSGSSTWRNKVGLPGGLDETTRMDPDLSESFAMRISTSRHDFCAIDHGRQEGCAL